MNEWKLRSPAAGVCRRAKQVEAQWYAAFEEAMKQGTHVVRLPTDHPTFLPFREPRQWHYGMR